MFYLKKANYLIEKKLLSVTLLIDIIRNNQYVVTEKKIAVLLVTNIYLKKLSGNINFVLNVHLYRVATHSGKLRELSS